MVKTETGCPGVGDPWVKGEPIKFNLTLSLKFLSVMLTGGFPGSWKIIKSLLQGEKIYSVRRGKKKTTADMIM